MMKSRGDITFPVGEITWPQLRRRWEIGSSIAQPQRNNGRRAYIAVARVLGIQPDPTRGDHAYAIVGEYLPFDRPVPFAGDGVYWEAPLRAIEDPSKVGQGPPGQSDAAARRRRLHRNCCGGPIRDSSARKCSPAWVRCRRRSSSLRLRVRPGHRSGPSDRTDAREPEDPRCKPPPTSLRSLRGPLRRSLARRSSTAAVDRKLVGRPASGRVCDGGPDVVQNGIALSGTIHWLFDRHLISLTRGSIGCSLPANKVPVRIEGALFAQQMDRINLLGGRTDCGRIRTYVERHREEVCRSLRPLPATRWGWKAA